MMRRPEEIVLTGCNIPTVHSADTLVLRDGRIAAVGGAEILPDGAEVRTLDLDGMTVLPGFVDAHTHFVAVGLREMGWETDLVGLSRDETLDRLADAARRGDDALWVIARGWDESMWQDRRYLERDELDRLAPNRPLIAARVDMHMLVANSAAMARIPPSVPREKVDAPRGLVREEAASEVLRGLEPPDEVLCEGLEASSRLANRLGITSIHAMLPAHQLPAHLRMRGRIRTRMTLCPEMPALDAMISLGIRSGFGDAWVRFGGLKIFADGSIGAGNAAVAEPYVDTGGHGALNHSDETLGAWVARAEEAGLQTVIHAIGDVAIEQVLAAHAKVGTSPELRHRIEHYELATPEQIARTAELGIAVSMQPNFVGDWSGEGKLYVDRLGEERDRRIDPHRSILDAGVHLAFGSDCMPISPLYGIHAAVNAPHPVQRVSVAEAVECYTEGGAYLSFEEGSKGRIEAGMLADLVVLDDDPLRVPERIRDLNVEMTFVGGEPVYESRRVA